MTGIYKASCPGCGAEVSFKGNLSIFQVCSYCKSTLLRQEASLEKLGSVSEVQFGFSPLQLGTRGRYERVSFELIGRSEVSWAEGYWNEWHVLFNDARYGWLAEAQGRYAMCFERELPKGLQISKNTVTVEQSYELVRDTHFQVTDIKQAKITAIEGELPRVVLVFKPYVSIDFMTPTADFATLECDRDYQPYSLFVGSYSTFDEFQFGNLREIDGWSRR